MLLSAHKPKLFVVRLPSAQIIVALGGLLSWSPLPLHVHRACTTLLSRQLLRPDGIRGLCAAIFGEEKSAEDEISLDKLQHIAKILIAVPAGIKPEVLPPPTNSNSYILTS